MVAASGLEHRRLAAAAVAASCAHPPALFHLRRRLNSRKVSGCERCWRWTKSVGILVLVGILLCLTIFYSDDQENGSLANVHHLEERSIHLRNQMDQKKEHTTHHHIHNGINKIRKLHGSMQKSKNIILLSYPRSGANLLGELLSVGPNAAHFLEPFGRHRKNSTKVTATLLTAEETLESLLSCQESILEKYLKLKPFRVIRRLGRWKSPVNNGNHIKPWQESASSLASKCQRTTVRVVETTRISIETILPLLQRKVTSSSDEWVVVHLVRDPRYILDLHTMGAEMTAKSFCDSMLLHIQLAKILSPTNYHLIRYEDLHNVPTLRQLYAFLGLSSWLFHAKEYLGKNQNGKRNRTSNLNNSKSGIGFKKISPIAVQRKVEKECKEVLQTLGYHKHSNGNN